MLKFSKGIIGSVKDGVENLHDLLVFLGNNPKCGITVISGNYHLDVIPQGYVLTESMGMWDEKCAESVYDNPDIEDYEEEEYIEAFPKSNSISIKEYMGNSKLQEHVDVLLSNGLYLTVNKVTKCFELYYEW